MDRVRSVLLFALSSSHRFRCRFNLSLKGGQEEQKIMALQNTSLDLVMEITPVQEAGHP